MFSSLPFLLLRFVPGANLKLGGARKGEKGRERKEEGGGALIMAERREEREGKAKGEKGGGRGRGGGEVGYGIL